MEKELRKAFNAAFTDEKYQAYLSDVNNLQPGSLDFRVAETPIYISKQFKNQMLSACENIVDLILEPNFKALTQRSIPKKNAVPGNDGRPEFIAFDFGICINAKGEYEPQLIELQGFPSLFAYQVYHAKLTADYAGMPANYSAYLSGYHEGDYVELLQNIVVGKHSIDEVILMELRPELQKTRIDFYCTEKLLGIKTVNYEDIRADGMQLYYKDASGKRINIKRIYNRLIFDDLEQVKDLAAGSIDLSQPYNVEWVPHPNWFFRISKFTLPFIHDPYVPKTIFLNEVTYPVNLSEYVLKPLFSFAGMGVIIDVTPEDIAKIKDPENWILQKKVNYADVIETSDGDFAKGEIRIFYFWEPTWKRPKPVLNLARMSKGKMIGTRYNKEKTWVGGTTAYFEED